LTCAMPGILTNSSNRLRSKSSCRTSASASRRSLWIRSSKDATERFRDLLLLRKHVHRVFAVVFFGKETRDALLAPYLFPGTLRVHAEMGVSRLDVAVDCLSRNHSRRIITVVNDGPRHTAED